MALRPWKARDPRSRHFVGVGAFNLVRASAYARAGGHAPIRLRPDDDIKLGQDPQAKRCPAGRRAGPGDGLGRVVPSLGETIDGLMKNSFAVVQYNPLLMLLGPACTC